MEDRRGLVPVSYLKTRGWTEKLIIMLLGEPDKLADNPHWEGGRNMRLYNMKRVKVAEKSEIFTKHLKRRNCSTESADLSIFFP